MTQARALKILNMGENVFLTGYPGAGKTYLLEQFIKQFDSNKIAVVAPTGIAASHLNGQTIHSFFRIKSSKNGEFSFDNSILDEDRITAKFHDIEVLVIDEVSMLHPKLFETIDEILKMLKEPFLPFGGIQVVLAGDFFQLPPIFKKVEKVQFIWQTELWQQLNLKVCYLDKVYRQSDEKLNKILMAIRDNKITQEVYRLLNSRVNAKLNIDHEPTKLYTVNKQVDLINQKKLETLTTESYFFQVQTKGHDLLIKRILKNSLISEMLELKIGAVVMFIKNDTSKRYVNGTTGVIQYFTERDIPVVKTSSGKLIEAEPQIWELDEILVEKDKYTGEVTKTKIEAKVSQIPLKLAWAITIHKSQGMSLDSAEIDLTRSFVEGQGYVALSRLRSFENFTLKGFNTKALEINLAVKDQDKIFKKLSDDLDFTLKI